MTDRRPRIAVLTFPGSNDDGDACLALEHLGAEAVPVWHTASELDADIAGIVLPGGFSYGDYLRCGALARIAPVMDAVRAFAVDGVPVLGICNGFQILCEAGLLPGVLRANRQLEFLCTDVTVTVESLGTPFTAALAPGDELVIPIKHGEGNWVVDDDAYAELLERGQIVLRYVEDVNGSRDRVAGVANEAGNVLGLMPHPEHAVDPAPWANRGDPAPRGPDLGCARTHPGLRARQSLARRGSAPCSRSFAVEGEAEGRRPLERSPKPDQVALTHGHGATPRPPVRRVREPHEPLPGG